MNLNRTLIVFTAAALLALAVPSMASALSFQETSQSPLPGLTGASDIATGDFDGDGIADLAVSVEAGVVVWLSNGDGTFTEEQRLAINVGVNASGTSVVAGDFNDDSKLDLAYSDGPYKVYIALGNGDGSFVAPDAGTKFDAPYFLGAGQWEAADFDGDGDDDLAFVGGIHSQSFEDAAYQVFISEGNGAFTPNSAVPVLIPVNSAPIGLAVGDYNDDEDLDLALLIQPFNFVDYAGNQILGEVGQGDGTFAAAANPISLGFTEGGFAYAEASADIDGNGGDDLVVTVGKDSSTIPLLGSSTDFLSLNGGGGMSGASLPTRVATADLDRDGLDDAITSYFGSASVGVGLGGASGDLTAAEGSPYGVEQEHFFSSAVAAADFDGDGYPDIAVASNANTNGGPLTQGVAVLINSPELGVAPSELDFGDVKVGETASRTVTLTGLGAPDAEVSQIALSGSLGGPFSIVDPSACETLSYGEECDVEIDFSPTAETDSSGTLEITSNTGPGGGAVSTVPLTGHGVAPGVELSPASQDFGSVEIGGASVTKSIAIRSIGGAPLAVTAVAISPNADFKLTNPSACIGSVAAGTSCNLGVSFAAASGPADPGAATLTVETDAGTRTAQLTGTATTILSPLGPVPSAAIAARLKLKAPAAVPGGKQVKLKVEVVNTGNARISGLALIAKAPKKLAKAPKQIRIANLGAGQSANRTFVVKLKKAATKGKALKLTVSAAADGRTLATGSLRVKVK